MRVVAVVVVVVAQLAACSSKEKPKMGMTANNERLIQLEQTKGTMQYGQNLTVTPAPGADLVSVSKDLVRIVGDKTDINALRVYLAPWQPQPGIQIPPLIASEVYADPTPWAPPVPTIYDSFAPIPVYARVMWGAGGIQHTAYVDWPKRGLLLQVSGSYVQINAFVNTTSNNAHVPAFEQSLPILAATIGPEPGGGDAANPATFSYPNQDLQDSGGGAMAFQNFQIPPFARAFTLSTQFPQIVAAGSTMVVATQEVPAPIGTIGNNDIQVWQAPLGGVYDQDMFTVDAIPIMSQRAGNVRVEFTPGGAGAPGSLGMIFLLDL